MVLILKEAEDAQENQTKKLWKWSWMTMMKKWKAMRPNIDPNENYNT
jgi:hypothetical protein